MVDKNYSTSFRTKTNRSLINYNLKLITKNYLKYFESLNKSTPILEIGPSRGDFIRFLLKLGFNNISVVEIDKKSIIELKKNFKNKIKIFEEDAFYFLKKNENNFKIILLRHVFEHFSKDQIPELKNSLYNSLENTGKLLIEVPNILNPHGFDTYYRDFTHLSPMSPDILYYIFNNFNKKHITSVKYPILDFSSINRFIISIYLIYLVKFIEFKLFMKTRFFGKKGPFSANILGVFTK